MKNTRSIKTCQKIFIRHNTDENRQLQAESGHHLLDQCDHILITTGPSVWYVCGSGSVWSKIIVCPLKQRLWHSPVPMLSWIVSTGLDNSQHELLRTFIIVRVVRVRGWGQDKMGQWSGCGQWLLEPAGALSGTIGSVNILQLSPGNFTAS